MMKKIYDGTWDSIRTHELPEWYQDCKLGIFIHWGIYSVPAYAPRTWELGEVPGDEQWFCNNPYAEWYYNSVNVGQGPTYEHHLKTYGKDFAYEDFLPMWKAENWKPSNWAELFREAGAKYVVLVTKHNDGFCLFPSAYTDYSSIHKGPERDIVGELTRAVREEGLKMGLYYSGIIDWRFAHDPIYREEDNFHKACPTHEYADYAYKQAMELIDRYHPSVFWNDIGWPKQGEEMLPHLLSHYYNTVEDGVVNDRFNGLYKDYGTKEYKYGEAVREEKWEMCRGMGLSFGYNANEGDDQLISTADLISLLVSTVANNGNLLINIGPKADGTIPAEQEKRLRKLGQWLKINGEAIYGTVCSRRHSQVAENGIEIHYTKKDKDLYILLDHCPKERFTVAIPHLNQVPKSLNSSICVSGNKVGDCMELTVWNHGEEDYSVGLFAPQGEI